jgi:hypothetical protein
MLSGRRILVVGMMLTMLLAGMSAVQAKPEGISGVSSGCNCHSGSADASVSVELSGVPSEYVAGQEYNLTVTITGGPTANASGNAQGGFNLVASAGTLSSAGTDTQIMSGEATHTEDGNDQRSWTVTWTAPASSDVTFTATGNSVDGDGSASSTDLWNQDDATSADPNPKIAAEETPGFSAVLGFAAFIGAGIALRRRQ